MTRQVRSHAKGCFIELDTLHENGLHWETNYRWNYAVQENVKRHGFTFPEADVLLLLDLSTQLVNEHIMLYDNAKDFADLSVKVCEHLVLKGESDLGPLSSSGEVAVARAGIAQRLASKNKDLQVHLDDLAEDPILMPNEGEHAMSINVFCSAAIESKQLVFVRLDKPVMCFMDCVIAAQYCLFCFGPPELEEQCIAEGCAFAAVMSDYNFEMAVKQAATPEDVLRGFVSCIEDLVVLPHVHMHNSIRVAADWTPNTSAPGTPSRKGVSCSPGGTLSSSGEGRVRNRPDAEDILEEILELCIQDFNHAKDENTKHDLHSETHQHLHEDGEAIVFDDSTHTESFVQMMAVDTDGFDAGRKRTRHRWHNALQQDCLSELCASAPKPFASSPFSSSSGNLASLGGGGASDLDLMNYSSHGMPDPTASQHSRRPSFKRLRSDSKIEFAEGTSGGHHGIAHPGGGGSAMGAVRTERRPSVGTQAGFGGFGGGGHRARSGSYFAKDCIEWSAPHLPHESAPLMALAADELSDQGCIFLDVEASDEGGMYRETGRLLRERMEVLGLCRLVGELGTDKLLAFLDHGGEWPHPEVADFDFSGDSGLHGGGSPRGSGQRGAAAHAGAATAALPKPTNPVLSRSISSPASFASPRSGEFESVSPPASPRLPGGGGRTNARAVTGAAAAVGATPFGTFDDPPPPSSSTTPRRPSFAVNSASSRRAKEEAELFMETDHGGCGTWHEECMEVLCVHSAVLPPGRRVVCLVRLVEGVESTLLGEGSPNIRWLYVCLGSFHPREVAKNEGVARAVSLFFASDDVFDIAHRAVDGSEILDAIKSFMRHACIVPRARPLGRVKSGMLAAQTMAQERLQAAHHMWENLKHMNRKEASLEKILKRRLRTELKLQQQMTHSSFLTRAKATIQKFSLPLLVGVLVALVFCNVNPDSYEYVVGTNHHSPEDYLDLTGSAHWQLLGHPLTIHFVVNDIFMVFFFGLAAKEVTEALLPGGALNPLNKALSPLLATLGGVVGPVVVYLVSAFVFYETGSFDHMTCEDDGGGGGGYDDHAQQDTDHRRLSADGGGGGGGGGGDDHGDDAAECVDVTLGVVLSGWGVPTATDISLAWMVAVLVFGLGHNAIGFLLLLAVVDDGIGLVIIAVFYPDPQNPVQGQYLPLIPLGMLVAYGLRRLQVKSWVWYVALAGPPSWFGFLLSHVHPALALVPIVPFLPSTHDGESDHDSEHHGSPAGSAADEDAEEARSKVELTQSKGFVDQVSWESALLKSAPNSVQSSPAHGPVKAPTGPARLDLRVRLGQKVQTVFRVPSSFSRNSLTPPLEAQEPEPWPELGPPPPMPLTLTKLQSSTSAASASMRSSSVLSDASGTSGCGGVGGGGSDNDLFGFIDFKQLSSDGSALGSGSFESGSGSRAKFKEAATLQAEMKNRAAMELRADTGSGDEGDGSSDEVHKKCGGDDVGGYELGLADSSLDAKGQTMEDFEEESKQALEMTILPLSGGGDGIIGGLKAAQPADAHTLLQQQLSRGNSSRPIVVSMDSTVGLDGAKHAHPALHQFEHDLKLFVDFGMFFFAFANAGVRLSNPGGLTMSIILALVVGKTLGISGFAIAGDYFFGIKLPDGVTYGDTLMVGFIASMGLTVALFVAGEAFSDIELQEEAKMGALLSGLVGPCALLLNKFVRQPRLNAAARKRAVSKTAEAFDAHVMHTTEEIDENVVREGLLRILKKRHADFLELQRFETLRGNSGPRFSMPSARLSTNLSQLKEDTLSI